MAGKSMLQRLFDTMQRSVDDDVSCVLNPRHCRELLERESYHVKYSDNLTERVMELNKELAWARDYATKCSNIRAGLSREVEAQIILNARLEDEIARLRGLLELERSDE